MGWVDTVHVGMGTAWPCVVVVVGRTPGGPPLPPAPGSEGNAEEPSCTGLEVEHLFTWCVKSQVVV